MSTTTPTVYPSNSFTPLSGLGPFRAADYWALPEGERVELINGWLVPMGAPTANPATFDAAYLATKYVVDVWLRRTIQLHGHRACQAESRRSLVIEVRSTRPRRPRSQRLRRYAELRVEEYWFVDPFERYILFYVLEAGRYVVHTGVDNRYQSPRLPEVEIDLAAFWREVGERLP